jgi:hypothetical protein
MSGISFLAEASSGMGFCGDPISSADTIRSEYTDKGRSSGIGSSGDPISSIDTIRSEYIDEGRFSSTLSPPPPPLFRRWACCGYFCSSWAKSFSSFPPNLLKMSGITGILDGSTCW